MPIGISAPSLAESLQTLPNTQALGAVNLANQMAYSGPTAAANLLGLQLQNAMNQANVPYRNMLAQANAMGRMGQAQLQAFQGQNPTLSLPGMAGAYASAQYVQNQMPGGQGGGAPSSPMMPVGGQNPVSQGLSGQPNQAPQGAQGQAPGQLPLSPMQVQRLQQMYGQGGQGGQNGNGVNLPGLVLQGATSQIQKNIADAQLAQRNAAGFNYLHQPKDQQTQQVAQLVGMGMDANSAVDYLTKGGTVPGYAQQNNFGNDQSKWPEPNFGQNETAINNIKNNQAAQSFLNTMEPIVSHGLGQFAPYIGKMSPVQIKQALTGMNPEQQAQFVSAIALQSDVATKRVQLGGGHLGKGAIEQMEEQSMQNIANYVPVNSSIYERAQYLTSQTLNQATDNYNQALKLGKVTAPLSAQSYGAGAQALGGAQGGNQDMVKVNINGQVHTGSRAQLSKLLQYYPNAQVING